MHTKDLIYRTDDACGQLTRYSGHVASEGLLLVLEKVTDINDDAWHGRDCRQSIDEAIALLTNLRKAEQ